MSQANETNETNEADAYINIVIASKNADPTTPKGRAKIDEFALKSKFLRKKMEQDEQLIDIKPDQQQATARSRTD